MTTEEIQEIENALNSKSPDNVYFMTLPSKEFDGLKRSIYINEYKKLNGNISPYTIDGIVIKLVINKVTELYYENGDTSDYEFDETEYALDVEVTP